MKTKPYPLLLFLFLMVTAIGCSSDPDPDEPIYDDPEIYIDQGRQYLNVRKPHMAANQFNMALQLDEDHFQAWLGLANSYQYWALGLYQNDPQKNREEINKKLSQARTAYKKASRLRPESPRPLMDWGRALFDIGKNSKENLLTAKKKFKAARKKIDPDEQKLILAEYHYYVGAIHFFLLDHQDTDDINFSEPRNHLMKYLEIYDSLGLKPPREKEIERILMDLDEQTGEQES